MKPTISVLAIEDNPDDAELIKIMLSKARSPAFSCVYASRLSQGLVFLKEGGFDVALLDLRLPDGAGNEVIEAVRKQSPDIPLIVLTGLDDEEVAIKLLRLDVQDYLIKGQIDGSLLVRSIQYAIERKRAIRALQRSELRFRRLSESGIIGISYFDIDGRITEANDTLLSMIGRSREDLSTGSVRWDSLVPRKWIPYMLKVAETFKATGRITPYETEYFGPGGLRHWGVFGAARLDGQPNGIAFIVDITERKLLEEQILHMANHDALTGLPNRRLFRELMRLELAEAHRNHEKAGLLFLDLDRFKEINDTLGHEAGDDLLKAVAGRLKSSIRESDIVARIGGDEFNVFFNDVARPEDITGLAQKMIDSLGEPILIAGHELHVTASIGISMYPDDSEEVDALFRYADIALYHAKERGRNTFQFYDHDLNQRSVEKLRFESWLRHALARGELTVYYQPLVDVKIRRIKSAEALVRWKHPNLGMLESKRFIPLAESMGIIASVDAWVLRTACAQHKAWNVAGFATPRVAVNISARMFRNPAFADAILGTLDDAGLTTKCLDFQIKENQAMDDIERNLGLLKKLADKGIGISIDDFGTGYSSLHRLKKFPVTRLKLDRSIVKNVATDPDSRTLISAIIAMAHKMNILVVAKGVETEEQLLFLREAECDEVQGYLFSEPVSAEQFNELMAASNQIEGQTP
jgi:diguanylate cyclase (GGDEF)-like protein/PAS domain S-box-containing protein